MPATDSLQEFVVQTSLYDASQGRNAGGNVEAVTKSGGREDGLTPLAREGEKFKRELPSAQVVVFDGCGHVPQVEKFAEFNAALLKFLSQ